MFIKEQYSPIPMAANSTYAIPDGTRSLGGFLAITAGTVTVTNNKGTVIVNALPVSAGVYYPLPFFLEVGATGSVALAGGASGTLGV